MTLSYTHKYAPNAIGKTVNKRLRNVGSFNTPTKDSNSLMIQHINDEVVCCDTPQWNYSSPDLIPTGQGTWSNIFLCDNCSRILVAVINDKDYVTIPGLTK